MVMAEILATKDDLEQMDTRLGNVEQVIRDLRIEMRTEFRELRAEMNSRFSSVDQRFMWLYGLLAALLLGVAGLWFK
jgi:hypothetical protein